MEKCIIIRYFFTKIKIWRLKINHKIQQNFGKMKIESMFVNMLMSSNSREVLDSIIILLFNYFLSTSYEPGTDKGRIVFLQIFTLQYKSTMNKQLQHSVTRALTLVAMVTFTSLSWFMATIFDNEQKKFEKLYLIFKN